VGDGDHLVAIHDHLRGELAQLRALVEEVERGHADAAGARHAISAMTLRQNDWTLGVYCQTYCRVVTMHHSIEDQAMYPRLRAADPSLGPALDRMVEEHHDVHGRLEELDRALVVLVADPDAGVAGVRTALAALEVTLLEHLAYEEGQLVEPLNRLGFGL
jgi:iron-sulfur cluster repair protein YtfE (RIC family)